MADEGLVELRATVDAESAKNSFEQLESALKQVAKLAENTDVDVDIDTTEARKTLDALGKELDQIDKQDVDVDVDTDDARSNLSGLSGAADTAAKAIKAFLATIAVKQVLDFGRAVLLSAANIETLQARLEGLGEDDSAGRIDDLRQLANDLGLEFETLVTQAVDFEASLKQAGFESDTARAIFEAMSVALKGAGADTQRVEQAFRALTQVASKGKISMEEIRQQLAEAIPGAANIVAASLGLTVEQFEKLAASGELISKEALPALAAGFEAAFADSVQNQIDSAATKLTQVANLIKEIGDEIGEKALPALKELADALLKVGENETAIVAIGGALASVLGVITDVVDAINALRSGNLTGYLARIGILILDFVSLIDGLVTGPLAVLIKLAGFDVPKSFALFRQDIDDARTKLEEWADSTESSGDRVNKTLERSTQRTQELADASAAGAAEAELIAAARISAARRVADATIASANEALQAVLSADKASLASALDVVKERIQAAAAAAKKLPEAEREAADLRIRELQRLLAKTKELAEDGALAQIDQINAVTLAEVEAAEKRKKVLADLSQAFAGFSSAQSSASSGSGSVSGPSFDSPDVSGFIPESLKREIADLEADIARLNEEGNNLFADSFSGTAVGQQMEARLQRLRQEAQETAESMANSFGQIRDAPANVSTQFLSSIDKIIAALETLPEGTRGPIQTSLAALAQLAEEGRLTADDIAASYSASAGAIAEAMGVAGGAAQDASQRILNVGSAATQAASEASASGSQYITLDESLDRVEVKAADAGEQIIKFGGEAIKVGEQAGQAADGGTIKFADELIEIGAAAKDAGDGAGQASSEISKVSKPASDAATAMGPLAEKASAVKAAFDPLVPSLQSAAIPFTSIADDLVRISSTDGAGTTIGEVGQALTENQDAIVASAPPLTTIGDAITVVNENAGASEVVLKLGDAVNGLVENETLTTGAQGFTEFADSLAAIETAATPVATALTAVGDGGKDAAAGLGAIKAASEDVIPEDLPKQINDVAGAVKALGTDLVTTNPLVEDLETSLDAAQANALLVKDNIAGASAELGQPLAAAVSSAKGSLDKLDIEFDETKKKIGETVDEVKKFESAGVPAIAALNAELDGTKQRLADITRLAGEALQAINAVNDAGGG